MDFWSFFDGFLDHFLMDMGSIFYGFYIDFLKILIDFWSFVDGFGIVFGWIFGRFLMDFGLKFLIDV